MKPTTSPPPGDLVRRIFRFGKKIDLAFDYNAIRPSVRSTIINECDYDRKNIIIAQSTPRVLPSFRDKKTKMTTMVVGKQGEKMRVGVDCAVVRFLKNYQISASMTEPAVVLAYDLPMRRSNIRGAYRVEPNRYFTVQGKITVNGRSLYSGKTFKVRDISGTGIGLPVIRTFNQSNPLLALQKGKKYAIELTLKDFILTRTITIQTNFEVIRSSRYSNNADGFIGGRYIGIQARDEERLFQFIRNAQAHQIRNGVSNITE